MSIDEVRFGQVPEAIRGKVEATTDLEALRKWHRLALRAGSPSEGGEEAPGIATHLDGNCQQM